MNTFGLRRWYGIKFQRLLVHKHTSDMANSWYSSIKHKGFQIESSYRKIKSKWNRLLPEHTKSAWRLTPLAASRNLTRTPQISTCPCMHLLVTSHEEWQNNIAETLVDNLLHELSKPNFQQQLVSYFSWEGIQTESVLAKKLLKQLNLNRTMYMPT
jgi:hypothetical protein